VPPRVPDTGGAGLILVSWDEAKACARWLKHMTGKDCHLLSEAEWEYAARPDNQSRYSFGDDAAVRRLCVVLQREARRSPERRTDYPS
jgi:formylglycine-generating enzyme required for sulfatase activity